MSPRHPQQLGGSTKRKADNDHPNHRFFTGLGRAFGGAILFSLPLMMTMEMWWLGFYIDRLRLALLVVLGLPLLTALSYYSGFEDTFNLKDELVDAFVAYAVGFASSAAVLGLLALITLNMSWDEVVGKIVLQAVPGGFGAVLATSQLGGSAKEEQAGGGGYYQELFIMLVGALFLALNVAPTEEMILISYKLTAWHALALVVASLIIMHGFVYAVEFKGQEKVPEGSSQWQLFLRFTVVGYAIALGASLYMLWTFGRTDGLGFTPTIFATLVLGFPAAVGAAAARLIL